MRARTDMPRIACPAAARSLPTRLKEHLATMELHLEQRCEAPPKHMDMHTDHRAQRQHMLLLAVRAGAMAEATPPG